MEETCKVCGSELITFEYLSKGSRFYIVRCVICGYKEMREVENE
jgi:transcription elongation factor Elf1